MGNLSPSPLQLLVGLGAINTGPPTQQYCVGNRIIHLTGVEVNDPHVLKIINGNNWLSTVFFLSVTKKEHVSFLL
jgi:hypothetical protein